MTSLIDISEKISDGIHTTPKYVDESEYYFINGNNLKKNKIEITNNTKRVTHKEYLKYKKELGKNTILLSINGTIGNLAYYNDEKVILGKSAAYINLNKGIDKKFIFNKLASSLIQNYFISELTGSTIRNLSIKTIKQTKFPLPPHKEQIEIAKTLSTWDKAIETTEKLIKNSQVQKKALSLQLLMGRKRFPKFIKLKKYYKTKYGELPKDWKFVPIAELASEITERNKINKQLPVLSCSKYEGFVDSLKYFKKKVYSDDTSNYKVIHRDMFGFPSNHIEEGSIGYQDIYDTGIVSPIYTVFKTKSLICNSFLYKLLKTEHYRQIFSTYTNASVDRRGSLRWREFSKLHIPLPSLEEQQKIAAVLSAADKDIELLQQKRDFLMQEKKALMQQLLTGKRRVKINNA